MIVDPIKEKEEEEEEEEQEDGTLMMQNNVDIVKLINFITSPSHTVMHILQINW